ncbi:tetratricopeptide repeat protein [Polyangium jinanense]|uniref:Sel1 repeat family protein n=1 Tax=Polyangium jinanense TaxID=2829994 RepID=A0A9X3X2P5_9BACT|nr:tetratricopeptide repeat protein [Polyangium jinanense]MDC3955384.1 sel1 repeat family protein [Polyangium jinanense]MDC3981685.1 sel1 repeat family protein [Polyangium jinanense]
MTQRFLLLLFASALLTGCGADPSPPSTPPPPAPDATPDKGRMVFIHGAGSGKHSDEIAAHDEGCQKNDLASCHALGLALMTPKDKQGENNKRAFAAFEKGCLGGYAASCNGLGVMYIHGMGVPRNPTRAMELYKRACGGDVSTACLHVAMAYESGNDAVVADWPSAVYYYESACTLGATQGCLTAGKAFAEGDRVERDPEKARKLYDRGCQEGDDDACKARDALK